MKKIKRIFSFLIAVLILVELSACSKQNEMYKKEYYDLFDTVCSLSAYDSSQEQFNEHSRAVYSQLKKYSDLLDIYNDCEGSLKQINDSAGSTVKNVDSVIIELLQCGIDACKETEGTVNIAMGSVLSLWHQKREEGKELPGLSKLKSLAKHTDIDKIKIDTENNSVLLEDKSVSIDVGAIAKGFVAEKIANYISDNNIWDSAVISLGGDIKVIGEKAQSDNGSFSIGITNPNEGDYLATVGIKNGLSIATSGDYQRYYDVDGKKYCHIIDPVTLMPAQYFSSVSVICSDAMLADEMSTYLFCLSLKDGQKIANSRDDVFVMWCDKNGKITYSDGFEDFLIE